MGAWGRGSMGDGDRATQASSFFLRRSRAPTLPRSDAPALRRSHAPTLPRSRAPTLPRSHAPTLPRSRAPTLPHSQLPIVISANPNVNSAIKYGNNKTEATLKDISRLRSPIAQRTKQSISGAGLRI